MAVVPVLETVVGGLLLFVLPGLALTRAVFPEWRLQGPGGLRRVVETATLAFVMSIVLTVLVGSFLLLSPGGFQAAWSDPVLEAVLAAITIVGFLVAGLRGGFSRSPPPSPVATGSTAEEGAWELTRELDRLAREERRLDREVRACAPGDPRAADLTRRLSDLRAQGAELRRRREEQYAE